MNKVLITLTPLGKFYFGGDTTFRTSDKDFDEEFSSYIIESRKFPQQTSLLGMLRYLVLSHSSKAFDAVAGKIKDQEEARKLIGRNSFGINGGKRQDFGQIQSLSACFLQMRKKEEQDWIALVPAPLDYDYTVSLVGNVSAFVNGIKKAVHDVQGYNPKEWNEPRFIGQGVSVRESDIFCQDTRVGIDRDFEGKTKDGAFYKQISYRLGPKDGGMEFRFAFNVEAGEDFSGYDGTIVSVGGDSSFFVLNVHKAEEPTLPSSYLSDPGCSGKIVLLSDAFLNPGEISGMSYAITETNAFRCLETSVDTEDYSILCKEVRRSKRLNLYRGGSVFYGERQQLDALRRSLDAKEDFRQIGYNQYQKIINEK